MLGEVDDTARLCLRHDLSATALTPYDCSQQVLPCSGHVLCDSADIPFPLNVPGSKHFIAQDLFCCLAGGKSPVMQASAIGGLQCGYLLGTLPKNTLQNLNGEILFCFNLFLGCFFFFFFFFDFLTVPSLGLFLTGMGPGVRGAVCMAFQIPYTKPRRKRAHHAYEMMGPDPCIFCLSQLVSADAPGAPCSSMAVMEGHKHQKAQRLPSGPLLSANHPSWCRHVVCMYILVVAKYVIPFTSRSAPCTSCSVPMALIPLPSVVLSVHFFFFFFFCALFF